MKKSLEELLKTRLKETEEKNMELGKFSDIVSHEIKEPICAIKTYNQIIREESWNSLSEEGRASVDEIDHFCEVAFDIVDGLLEQSKTKRKQLRLSLIDMNHLVRDVLDEIANMSQHKDKKIELKCYTLPNIIADKVLMRQVVYNIFSNSIKFAKENQDIILTVDSCSGEMEDTFYFKDNGIGFDMKYADKLFKIFNRLCSNTEYEGSGIGLYTIRYIIEKHNGSVFIASEENEGCVVGFKLPIRRE